jgi:proteasome lid subunit RPN8/RPN11
MVETTWSFPIDLLDLSVDVMRPNGRIGNEGLALWLGASDGGQARITHLVALRGDGFHASPLQLRLSWNAMSKLTDLADELGAYLVGQIHSHPGRYIDLSEVDEKYGVRCQDYLSVVCPHYAQREVSGIQECGVHLFDGGRYRRFGASEVTRRIALSNATVEVVNLEVPA